MGLAKRFVHWSFHFTLPRFITRVTGICIIVATQAGWRFLHDGQIPYHYLRVIVLMESLHMMKALF